MNRFLKKMKVPTPILQWNSKNKIKRSLSTYQLINLSTHHRTQVCTWIHCSPFTVGKILLNISRRKIQTIISKSKHYRINHHLGNPSSPPQRVISKPHIPLQNPTKTIQNPTKNFQTINSGYIFLSRLVINFSKRSTWK